MGAPVHKETEKSEREARLIDWLQVKIGKNYCWKWEKNWMIVLKVLEEEIQKKKKVSAWENA